MRRDHDLSSWVEDGAAVATDARFAGLARRVCEGIRAAAAASKDDPCPPSHGALVVFEDEGWRGREVLAERRASRGRAYARGDSGLAIVEEWTIDGRPVLAAVWPCLAPGTYVVREQHLDPAHWRRGTLLRRTGEQIIDAGQISWIDWSRPAE